MHKASGYHARQGLLCRGRLVAFERFAPSQKGASLIMSLYRRCAWALGLLFVLSGAAAVAAPMIEGTPVPMAPKPDFSSMRFLIGTWTCTDMSSRRPGPFTTTEVFSMDPTGYWMIRNDTIHTA